MDIGNVIAALLPLPLGLLWLGLSPFVYIRHQRHPDPKVGNYTRRAAYRLYGIVGVAVAIAALVRAAGPNAWYSAWAVAALILIPWSLWSLARIRRDHWEDIVLPN